MGFFEKISAGLKKTRDSLMGRLEDLAAGFTKVDEDFFDELEETLIMGDVGANVTMRIMDELRDRVRHAGITEPTEVIGQLREIITGLMGEESPLDLSTKPSVVLVIGVNGVGKTTTIGKMAAYLRGEGKQVLLAAADTFRAAAAEQLAVWADRAGAELIRHEEGSDPASVVFDAIHAGKSRGADVIICDTAGRLHNKKNLMDELSKIARVISRELPDAAVEVLLVLDATTGQNAISQARSFQEAAGITGIVLTKLDGTAKGGAVIGIREELGVPVKFIGVGEGIDDLRPFVPAEFAAALFEGQEL
ncbi:signal recognition particle-docking protein FtsY [Hydrogenoanaerobacterium saccharovorans]|uniref:Signal recognition particle receptor FtsY n=1 Tax=Hydrogenoanaerobacterium saccharovorans TaxID=474960 RepID=A0ABS2GJL5_9FIRM|nr:signal recognition particle-docking protein FtsY [Hydrogenoanaerobacterium saccharovorans]MBM6922311.1 signal recognition particle-docking protein FtsY [Hydrogenoanaerobacterium saccharovorans]